MPDTQPASPSHHGLHLTADLRGCPAEAPWMTDAPRLREDSLALVRQFGLHAVGTHFHSFTPTEPGQGSGVTGVVLLAESHVAMHTWPESGRVSIDVFVCNVSVDHSQGAQALLDALIEGFRPDLVRRQALQRG